MASNIIRRRKEQPKRDDDQRLRCRWLLGLTIGSCLTGVHLWITIGYYSRQTNSGGLQIFASADIDEIAVAPAADALPLPLPRQCSSEDLDTVKRQLPNGDCSDTFKMPWQNECSFSYATRCPEAVWLTEQYTTNTDPAAGAAASNRIGASTSTDNDTDTSMPPALAIYVGCNKAMDAVNSLRMISGDATYDRDRWRDLFFEGHKFEAGRCGQDTGEQFPIAGHRDKKKNTRNAVVHCIEAMPVTATRLNETVQALGWQNQLVVSNVAVSDTDGSILFPDVKGKVGVENLGIENCQGKDAQQLCKNVPLYRLDTFAEQFLPKDGSLVDFLSIDVEGFDYDVLLGAPQSLKRTKYVEFEYNWKGKWKDHKLSTAVDMLKDSGFVCYWAGSFGRIWRITDCWLDYYDLKFWSNVACVNVRLPEAAPLAARMEELFRQTLAAGRSLSYSSKDTANTDGGIRAEVAKLRPATKILQVKDPY